MTAVTRSFVPFVFLASLSSGASIPVPASQFIRAGQQSIALTSQRPGHFIRRNEKHVYTQTCARRAERLQYATCQCSPANADISGENYTIVVTCVQDTELNTASLVHGHAVNANAKGYRVLSLPMSGCCQFLPLGAEKRRLCSTAHMGHGV